MSIKKDNPSKVIIIPRPPRSNNEPLVPVNSATQGVNAEPVNGTIDTEHAPLEFVDPGVGPMNNQVEGPATGLAGVPKND